MNQSGEWKMRKSTDRVMDLKSGGKNVGMKYERERAGEKAEEKE